MLKLQDCLISLPNHHTKRKYFEVKLSCQKLRINARTRFDLKVGELGGKEKNIDDIQTIKHNASMSECVQPTKIIGKKRGRPCG
jgi:hypothetical protein